MQTKENAVVNQDVVTPAEIGELKQALIEAVTNAYMAKRVPELTGLQFDHGTCSGGEFHYKSPSRDNVLGFSLEADTGYYVSYPEGQWKESYILWDSEKAHDDGISGTAHLIDASASYQQVDEEVSSWIDPWVETCPNPNDFKPEIDWLADIAPRLNIDHHASSSPDDPSWEGTSPVPELRSAVEEIEHLVAGVRGRAVDALQRTYVSDLPTTLRGQQAMINAALISVVAQGIAWNESLTVLRDFVTHAIEDFNSFAASHAGSSQTTRDVFGATAAVAGLAAAVTTLAFPPFGSALWVVSAAASVGALMFDAEGTNAIVQLTLTGSTYEEYWTSFTNSVLAISDDLSDAELAINLGCSRIKIDYFTHPDNYSLTATFRNETGGQQGPLDNLRPFMASEVSMADHSWPLLAGAIESIGDRQRVLATALGSGTQPGALSHWSRGTLPAGGTIGFADTGACASADQVIDIATDLLLRESKTAHRIAEKCLDVATGFRLTDEEIERRLNAKALVFESVGAGLGSVKP